MSRTRYIRTILLPSDVCTDEYVFSNPHYQYSNIFIFLLRSIETQNSKDAKEAAARGVVVDAKSPIGFVEVRVTSQYNPRGN